MKFYAKLSSASLILLVIALTVASTHFVPNVFAAGNDDSNNKEVGVWWVVDYWENPEDLYPNMWMNDENAEGFYDHLGSKGFTLRFNRGDDAAWESHFEKGSVGGYDSYYVDAIDFVFFAGHGDQNAFKFGTDHDNDNQHTFKVHYSEADWGDKDLEWIFIFSCEVLKKTPTEWNPAFHNPKTLHGMTGFHTDVWQSDDFGTYFAKYLTDTWGPNTIKEAWRKASQDDPHQDSDIYFAIYAVCVHYFPWTYKHYWNEYLPGYGGGMYSDPPTKTSRMVRAIYLEYYRSHC